MSPYRCAFLGNCFCFCRSIMSMDDAHTVEGSVFPVFASFKKRQWSAEENSLIFGTR